MQLLPRAQRSATKAQFQVSGQKTHVFCPPGNKLKFSAHPKTARSALCHPCLERNQSAIRFQAEVQSIFRMFSGGNRTIKPAQFTIESMQFVHVTWISLFPNAPILSRGKMDAFRALQALRRG